MKRDNYPLGFGEDAKRIEASNDPNRIKALVESGLLKRTNDERLRSLAMTARMSTRTACAMVNVHDTEEHHLAIDPEQVTDPQKTEDSGCSVVIVASAPVAVDDTWEHPIMCQFSWSKQWRAYLGVPVMFEDFVVGTVCVLDTQVRKWTPWDEAALVGVARLAGLSVLGKDGL